LRDALVRAIGGSFRIAFWHEIGLDNIWTLR